MPPSRPAAATAGLTVLVVGLALQLAANLGPNRGPNTGTGGGTGGGARADAGTHLPATGADSGSCSPASASRPLPLPAGPLLQPASIPAAVNPAAAAPANGDYRQQLSTTALGWPRLERWCVWLEPVNASEPAALWEQRWWQASQLALQRWQRLLPIERVDDPAAAQIRLLRRRPPRQPGPDGRLRASHGRANLQLLEVTRAGQSRVEPSVEVLISPGQRPQAIEATALHELGHAFGLWGHSDRAEDAMAAVPGAAPVLELSPRDRATLRWLYGQPTRFGAPLQAEPVRAAGKQPAGS
ncbi:MAG: peptidase [Cyanobacteria bacterium]|nr:peptidase [Cyanobacteriota bacterium]